jgi:hypothetical protein
MRLPSLLFLFLGGTASAAYFDGRLDPLNPKDVKLYHLDLKSRCLTTTSKANGQEFSACARQSLDDLLSKETQAFLDRHAPFHIRCAGFDLEDNREATHE